MAKNKARQTQRLKGYDYSQTGGYFVTICTYQNQDIFGEIVKDFIVLNEFGRIVENEWKRTEIIRKEITLDEFVIMPNHVHGIIIIDYVADHVGAHGRAPLPEISESYDVSAPLHRNPGSLGSIIAGFKSTSTKRINLLHGTPGKTIWQRGYHDRIIRDAKELDRIREYILNNPANFGIEESLF